MDAAASLVPCARDRRQSVHDPLCCRGTTSKSAVCQSAARATDVPTEDSTTARSCAERGDRRSVERAHAHIQHVLSCTVIAPDDGLGRAPCTDLRPSIAE